MSWNFTSTPAMRRRSSILALSTPNLTDTIDQTHDSHLHRTVSSPLLYSQRVDQQYPSSSSTGPKFKFPTGSVESSPMSGASPGLTQPLLSPKRKRRQYDGVYRTNEPLPGKPLIEFEDKVWDLEEEYSHVNERARRLLDEQYNDDVRRSAARYYENAPLHYGRVQADLV